MAAATVSLIGCHQVDQVWPLVADGLEAACRKTGGDTNAHYLWSECRSGHAFLAVVTDETGLLGASTWRFENWADGKKLRCIAMYGRRMKDWLPIHREFTERMARVGGATALVTDARKGFQKIFPEARVLRQLYEVRLDG